MTTQTPRRPGTNPATHKAGVGRSILAAVRSVREALGQRPGLDYLMLRIIVFILVGIGLLMAFSATLATSWFATQSPSVWFQATRQLAMVVVGLATFWVALKVPPRIVRRFSGWLLVIALVLLIVVLTPAGTGSEEVGSQSWIVVGQISIQPSEVARVAIALFGADLLANRRFDAKTLLTLKDWLTDPFIIYLGVSAVFFGLILAEGDVGMGMSFALVVAFTLLFAGMYLRFFLVAVLLVAVGMIGVFLSGGYRSNRFHTYFDAFIGHIEDTQGTGFQTYQGFLSLADGGAAGVGLGQSRAKWFYLPEARNDFVFAIVGEELGLWGAALVVLLFAALGYFGIRTAMRAQNQFQALLAATLTAGVVSQALFNISYVIGLLPVTGIQLPMISSGGSATIITIGSMGVLCNLARHEPQQISAIQSYGRPFFDRIFLIQEPEPEGFVPAPRGGRRRADGSGKRAVRSEGRGVNAASAGRTASAVSEVERSRREARRREASRARFGEPVTGNRRRFNGRETTDQGRS